MNSPTPETYVSDFLEDKKRTELQKWQIWDESYRGRQISWCGELHQCHKFSDHITVSVLIHAKGGEQLFLGVDLPRSEKENLLSFHVGDYVRVTGVLKRPCLIPDYSISVKYDARISHA